MILAIDIGNTNIVIGKYDEDKLVYVARMVTDAHRSESEYAVSIKNILSLDKSGSDKVDGAIISSVVPPLTKNINNAIKMLYDVDALIVGPGIKTGVNICIHEPATLGADLVVACAGAQSIFPVPCIVISMGTATAMFVIDKNKRMLGGTIAPGVSISLDALTAHGALIPSISLTAPQNVIGKNTDDSIRSGVVIGTACMIDGMIDKIEGELKENCTVVATGGIAPMIVNSCSHNIILKDDLILEGLRIIYDKNK